MTYSREQTVLLPSWIISGWHRMYLHRCLGAAVTDHTAHGASPVCLGSCYV